MLGSLLTNLGELFQKRRDGMNFMRGGKEESILNQASICTRDHVVAILVHLPWRGRRFGREEEKRRREKEERRESKNPIQNLERESQRGNEIFCPKIK
jgi:hypothetical protein